ncbi:hypothetical protein [Bacillus thermotolerans]|uniref:Lipoprotein n=1 Tax=Bacillus thermotolerans TaxID=1221996 RepID=A0A0F5I128_BACTR|nr:hypothetical protein [Bacillus thermotolerans]KKB39231.1 hypothetical protein QY97_00133 [Bacillus thermotolerans]KKB41988.1 hypothetical protein QY96_01783 [Bacillus thermotolerans]KKB42247.1 hypothetical protein QY95_00096 [Bacillus thermotolerans]
MRWLVIVAAVMMTAGCKQAFPEPEAWLPSTSSSHAEAQAEESAREWTVHHLLRGNNVLVELVVPGVSFSAKGTASQKAGQAAVYINGQHFQTYHTAAFIVKGLPSGTHKVDIKLLDQNNQPLGYEKSFNVSIPS